MYKLVVIDIDGTLITPKRKITKRNIDVLNRVKNMGVNIVISTGRNKRLTKNVMRKLGHQFLYACVGGSEIYDTNHEPLYKANLSIDEIKNIFDFLKDRDCFIQLTRHDGYYKYVPSETARKYDVFSNKSIKGLITNMYIGITQLKDYGAFYQHRFHDSNEIIVGSHEKNLQEIKIALEDKWDDLQARDDLWSNYLFISRKNNSKASAIDWLCEYYKVDVSEVIAIGDDLNDCDMLEKAGLGIAMGNAIEAVKKVADDITYTNEKSGVAHALDHYIINKRQDKINYIE